MTTRGASFALFLSTLASFVFGFSGLSQATDDIWGTDFQAAVTPTMVEITNLYDLLFIIITVITLLVLALLIFVMVRFNHKANPTPSTNSHNTLLEIVWTAVPVLILVVIAIPSLKLLYAADRNPDTEMTIKAIGHQWYWAYEYPDHGDFTFDAYMIPEADLKEGQPRLLATDNAVVVPVNTKIRLLVTAGDVIHSFAMPAFGVKLDGVPGRINETWFEVTEPGTYYGQCSEICGTGHSFMPIEVRAVEKAEFDAWVKKAQDEFAGLEQENAPLRVAAAQ
ncbi:cytochrome c oxidase subunit II [Kiloniella sp. b19]|uniref:cytochrome c oxidase subunit II n=1 Tax=Kiloniella sp. GXU_MW_B19 TaxID=3141326 RepID=UPI0031CEFEAF